MAWPKRKLFIILSCPLPLIIYLLGLYIAYTFVGPRGNDQTHNKGHERIVQGIQKAQLESTSAINLLEAKYQKQKLEINILNISNRSSVSNLNIHDNLDKLNPVTAPNTTDTSQ